MDSIINTENLSGDIGDNLTSDYLPVKTNYNECSWEIVSGYFIGYAYKVELKKYSKQEFEEDCKKAFLEQQVSEKHFSVINKAFFESKNYLKLAPTNLLLHTQTDQDDNSKVNTASKKIASSLLTLMGDRTLELPKEENEHFIAETITSTLKKKLEVNQDTRFPLTYLPYLQEKFISDYDFLASKPSYLLEQITNFLSLYSFLYVSQIALNIKEWRAGIPKSKPLYFVVDTEKVSSERNKVIDLGWKSFEKVSNNLFPMLSTLQLIQNKESRKPIWQIYSEMLASDEHSQFIDCLDNYCERFVEARALRKSFIKSPDIESAFEQLFDLTLAQFDKQWADPSTTRYQANGKVVAALKEHTAKGFVKSKGRIGNIFALI
jgi:DNA phosphorothioation-dependent restriction protein DptG